MKIFSSPIAVPAIFEALFEIATELLKIENGWVEKLSLCEVMLIYVLEEVG